MKKLYLITSVLFLFVDSNKASSVRCLKNSLFASAMASASAGDPNAITYNVAPLETADGTHNYNIELNY